MKARMRAMVHQTRDMYISLSDFQMFIPGLFPYMMTFVETREKNTWVRC